MPGLTVRQTWFAVVGFFLALVALDLLGLGWLTYLAATDRVPPYLPLMPIIVGIIGAWLSWRAVERGYEEWGIERPRGLYLRPPRRDS